VHLSSAARLWAVLLVTAALGGSMASRGTTYAVAAAASGAPLHI
jgi:hypothetical protein